MSELPHPIISKAADSFPHAPDGDNYVGQIACSHTLRLMEIKSGQWRGGVWRDDTTGVHWLLVAGLAKGDHEDHDDFYKRVEGEAAAPDRWLPTSDDERLLKQETAARLLTKWHLEVQRQLLSGLRQAQDAGSARLEVAHPIGGSPLATVTLEVTLCRDEDYQADEIGVELSISREYVGRAIEWELITRTLVTIYPPEQEWDRFGDTYSNLGDPGYVHHRIDELDRLVRDNELAQSEPGQHAHYTHRAHLAGNTIDGKAVRALCGVYFVPTQDHAELPCCPRCEADYQQLPAGPGDHGLDG